MESAKEIAPSDVSPWRYQCQTLRNLLKEKEEFVHQSSREAIEIVSNWFEQIINDLMDCQSQIIEDIEQERDRARDELDQYHRKIDQLDQSPSQAGDASEIAMMVEQFRVQISQYELTRDMYFPESRFLQPRYKLFYQSKGKSINRENKDDEEEDWDLESDEPTRIPLPSNLILSTTPSPSPATTTTAKLFFSDPSTVPIHPNDDEDDVGLFDWSIESDRTFGDDVEYLLDPNYYIRGKTRHFDSDIHLMASNGSDLLFVLTFH